MHAKKDNSFSARGVLEVMQDGYGFLRSPDYNYMPGLAYNYNQVI